jgi:Clr5 domain
MGSRHIISDHERSICPDTDSPSDIPYRQKEVRWVTTEEWLAQRTNIKRLYLDQGRTLKEVMGIIENKYGFKATYVDESVRRWASSIWD